MTTLLRCLLTVSLSSFLFFQSDDAFAVSSKSCGLNRPLGANYTQTMFCGNSSDPVSSPPASSYDPNCEFSLGSFNSCSSAWRCYDEWGDICKRGGAFEQCARSANWFECIDDFLPPSKEPEPEPEKPTSPTSCTNDTWIFKVDASTRGGSVGYGLTLGAACGRAGGKLSGNNNGCLVNGWNLGNSKVIASSLSSEQRIQACSIYNPEPEQPEPEPEPETPAASEPKPDNQKDSLKDVNDTLDKILNALLGDGDDASSGEGSGNTAGGGGGGGGANKGILNKILDQLSTLTGTGTGDSGYDDGFESTGEAAGFGVGDGGIVELGGSFTVHSHFATSSTCPAPVVVYGHSFVFDWVCEVLFYLSRVLISMAYLYSAFIFYSALVGRSDD